DHLDDLFLIKRLHFPMKSNPSSFLVNTHCWCQRHKNYGIKVSGKIKAELFEVDFAESHSSQLEL
uniref:Uncharacterized protein n=1 Tax=Oryctolagus cuniculus TaxID=9986 RepID=A0A5F9CNM7_RABIT